MSMLIAYMLLALLVSFFCSIAEAVLLSVRPTYVVALERRKAPAAQTLRALRDRLDRPLAAILSLNTIAHTVGAVGVGGQAAVVFGSGYVGVASGVLTLLVLVLSEIIPKTLGATYWRQLAPVLAPMIMSLTRILLPFVWLSEKLTRLLARGHKRPFTFSRDEIEAMAEIGAQEGALEMKEMRIVSNLMRLRALSVRDVMTPRSVIFMLQANMTVSVFFEEHASEPFSRIPIYDQDRDDVVGYVLKSELFAAQAHDQFDRALREFKRSWLTLPDILTVSACFDRLVREQSHIALVVDEYGTVQGLLTLEDILETLIGLEITDELDTVADMQALAHRRWKERMAVLGIDPESLDADR